MRNLKRVLSLAMAAAMLIGMMVISAGAASTYEDFTDKDEIQNTEAVKTMVSLGVINGKDDGSYFDPSGIVTRAEMAALIARCLNGGVDPSLGTGASTTSFSDTKGHWAEPYIAYCANLGIINGKGDGTFGPDEQVTGTAAAKMFLCALGYRSDIEKLTGPGWDLNTDSKANEVGLYNGLVGLAPSSGLNRDNTAQLIYNGVQANMVVYRNNYGEYSGVINSQPVNGTDKDSEPSTMLYVRFGVNKVVGVVTGNEYFALDNAPLREGRTRISYTPDDSGAYSGATGTFNVSTDAELIGQKVVLYVKPTSKLSPNPEADVVLGDAIVANSNVVVTTSDRYTTYTTTEFDKFLRNNGLSVKSSTVSYKNYESDANFTQNLRGEELTVIDYNDDGVVDYMLKTYHSLARVSVYNTSKDELTLSNGEKADFDDVIGVEDIAANDYVLYFKANGKLYVEKAEPVTATVDAFVANKTVTLDGTVYNMSALGGQQDGTHLAKISDLTRFNNASASGTPPMTTELGVPAGDPSGELELGDSYDLYLDHAGNIIAWEPADTTAGNYALVLETVLDSNSMNSAPTGRVSLLLADGTRVSGSLDVEGTQANYKRADTTANQADTARAFADYYVAKVFNGFDASGDADTGAVTGKDDGRSDTSRLAGTIVTYSESNGSYVLRPTNMLRTGYDEWKNAKNDTDIGTNTAITNASGVGKGMTALNLTAHTGNDGKSHSTIIVNENTIFLFASGKFGTETVSMIQGSAGLKSGTPITATRVKAVAYNERTNVARVVYVNDDSGVGVSNYMYVEKNPTTRTVDGTRRVVYKAVNKDGEFVELITKALDTTMGGTIYKVELDGKGLATLTPAGTAATTDYLTESSDPSSLVNGSTFDHVAGRIDAIDGGVITVMNGDRNTWTLNVSGKNGIYVDDVENPTTVSLSIGQKVDISFKKDDNKPAVESVFVTELFSDEVPLPAAALPTVTVKAASSDPAAVEPTVLINDGSKNIAVTTAASHDKITIDLGALASGVSIDSISLVTVSGSTEAPVGGFSQAARDITISADATYKLTLAVKGNGTDATSDVVTGTYTFVVTNTAADTLKPTLDGSEIADVEYNAFSTSIDVKDKLTNAGMAYLAHDDEDGNPKLFPLVSIDNPDTQAGGKVQAWSEDGYDDIDDIVAATAAGPNQITLVNVKAVAIEVVPAEVVHVLEKHDITKTETVTAAKGTFNGTYTIDVVTDAYKGETVTATIAITDGGVGEAGENDAGTLNLMNAATQLGSVTVTGGAIADGAVQFTMAGADVALTLADGTP